MVVSAGNAIVLRVLNIGAKAARRIEMSKQIWSGQPSETYLPPEGARTPLDRKLEVLDAMERYGGGFVRALAEAWRKADSTNEEKLQRAFPEYWQQYSAMAGYIGQ